MNCYTFILHFFISYLQQQIFHTTSVKRWNITKWIFRLVCLFFILAIPIFIIALFQKKPILPSLNKQSKPTNSIVLEKEKSFTKAEEKKYAGINTYLQNEKSKPNTVLANKVRAGFYVNWDINSFNSLETHIHELNMVLPECFSIDPIGDTLTTSIDKKVITLAKANGVKVVPVLSNVNELKGDDEWDNDLLYKVLSNTVKRNKLIQDIVININTLDVDGINIDFEEWDEKSFPYVVKFQQQLYDTLHTLHKIVSQDIVPLHENNESIALSKYNDYMFLMAYNQHWSTSEPGDICEQRWIEKVLDQAAAKIPIEKLIVCIAGFGYDWKENTEAKSIKYSEALSLALNNKATIIFDNDTYNSHFEFVDENKNYHEVYFFDAAGMFNIMRLSDEIGNAGTALWRLGSEDERMWTFYKKDLSNSGLQANPFDFNLLKDVKNSINAPCYIGEGEILDVQSSPQNGSLTIEIDSAEKIISEQHYTKYPTQYVIKKWGTVNKQVVLTFDDGPDETYTPQILDILEKEKVPATFFITGSNAHDNLPLLKRIHKDGFEIGNHTFTHPNISTVSNARAELELKSTRLLIEAATGRSTVLFRAPYNADSEPTNIAEIIPVALSKKQNYYTIGESIDPCDWEDDISADSIYTRIVNQYESNPKKGVILLHDAGGNREATVKALPKIIQYFKVHGIAITTIGSILGKSPEEIMPIVNSNVSAFSNIFAVSFYGIKKLISILFAIAFSLSLFRIIVIMSLALLQKIRSKKEQQILLANNKQPAISIIVPAYNEEVTSIQTIQNLLQLEYPNFNIIFIDDGSTDNTFKNVCNTYSNHKQVQLFTKQNGGKASALNYGIELCTTDFVLCIDADTVLLPNALTEIMRFFYNDNIGAVAGNVKVGNQKNILTKWQAIEYITAQNIDRRAFDYVNGIAIIPGAIGAFRKEAILKAGGFTSDTLAEDCDLTIRINTCGYVVRNCNTAIAITEAPETVSALLKQRFRWNYGVMQSFWKNRKACFNIQHKGLGFFGLPNILLFQIIIPLISPLADLLFIFSIFWQSNISSHKHTILISYLLLLLVDLIFSGIAFYFEKEPYKKLWYIIPQRFIYKQMMYIVIIKSIAKALKGDKQQWGTIQRTGNVTNPIKNSFQTKQVLNPS